MGVSDKIEVARLLSEGRIAISIKSNKVSAKKVQHVHCCCFAYFLFLSSLWLG